MPLRKAHITYREWRERGETMLGAFIRAVPFQYIWAALLALLASGYFVYRGYFGF